MSDTTTTKFMVKVAGILSVTFSKLKIACDEFVKDASKNQIFEEIYEDESPPLCQESNAQQRPDIKKNYSALNSVLPSLAPQSKQIEKSHQLQKSHIQISQRLNQSSSHEERQKKKKKTELRQTHSKQFAEVANTNYNLRSKKAPKSFTENGKPIYCLSESEDNTPQLNECQLKAQRREGKKREGATQRLKKKGERESKQSVEEQEQRRNDKKDLNLSLNEERQNECMDFIINSSSV